MVLLQVKDLSKAYGVDHILQQVSFQIASGEKVGLVGVNGAGKTTLFKCLTGVVLPDEGQITVGDKVSMGYLEQLADYPEGTKLFSVVVDSCIDILTMRDKLQELEEKMALVSGRELEKVMEQYSTLTEEYERAGGYGLENKVRRIIKGLGFADEDLNRDVHVFSGGEKTRVSLAKLLVQEPDLLLLDEPTNHLDVEATEWLEDFLKGYPGAVLVISHDRFFLDQVASRILELEHRRLFSYNGNYTRYLDLKAERVLAQTRAYEKQQAEVARTEAYIERYRAGIKARQARGRQSQLERLERVEQVKTNQVMRIQAGAVGGTGEMVLQVRDLAKTYEDKIIFNQVSFTLRRGDKVGLIGSNGAGKTTVLKIIIGQLEAQGVVTLGSRVQVAYYDQAHQNLDVRRRVIDELIFDLGLTEGVARNHLATVLFQGDEVYRLVGELSGGERARLAFLKLVLEGANLLVLDEPTNHLDIFSREIIETFLTEYPGTVLFVSHDRYFIDQIADRVIELAAGQATEYWGNYTYYKQKKAAWLKEQEEALALQAVKLTQQVKGKDQRDKPRTPNAKRVAEAEALIARLEEEKDTLGQLLASPELYQDEERAKLAVQQFKDLEVQLEDAYLKWEQLVEG